MKSQKEISPSMSLNDAWTHLDVDVAALSHQGHVRENNEDTFLVIKFGRSLENLLTNIDHGLLSRDYSMCGYGMGPGF